MFTPALLFSQHSSRVRTQEEALLVLVSSKLHSSSEKSSSHRLFSKQATEAQRGVTARGHTADSCAVRVCDQVLSVPTTFPLPSMVCPGAPDLPAVQPRGERLPAKPPSRRLEWDPARASAASPARWAQCHQSPGGQVGPWPSKTVHKRSCKL